MIGPYRRAIIFGVCMLFYFRAALSSKSDLRHLELWGNRKAFGAAKQEVDVEVFYSKGWAKTFQ